MFPSDKNNWGPRIGVNWDVTRQGRHGPARRIRHVLRPHHQLDDLERHHEHRDGDGPAVADAQLVGHLRPSIRTSSRTLPRRRSGPTSSSSADDTQNPLIHQFDIIFDQRIAANTVLSVSYVGSQGRNLPIFIDQNLNPATTTNTYVVTGGPLDGQRLTVPLFTTPRPNANFSQMTQITSGVDTSYNALVLALNRRFTKGLQVQTSYTLLESHGQRPVVADLHGRQQRARPVQIWASRRRRRTSTSRTGSASARCGSRDRRTPGSTTSPSRRSSLCRRARPFTALVSGNAPQANRVLTGILGNGGTNRLPTDRAQHLQAAQHRERGPACVARLPDRQREARRDLRGVQPLQPDQLHGREPDVLHDWRNARRRPRWCTTRPRSTPTRTPTTARSRRGRGKFSWACGTRSDEGQARGPKATVEAALGLAFCLYGRFAAVAGAADGTSVTTV